MAARASARFWKASRLPKLQARSTYEAPNQTNCCRSDNGTHIRRSMLVNMFRGTVSDADRPTAAECSTGRAAVPLKAEKGTRATLRVLRLCTLCGRASTDRSESGLHRVVPNVYPPSGWSLERHPD